LDLESFGIINESSLDEYFEIDNKIPGISKLTIKKRAPFFDTVNCRIPVELTPLCSFKPMPNPVTMNPEKSSTVKLSKINPEQITNPVTDQPVSNTSTKFNDLKTTKVESDAERVSSSTPFVIIITTACCLTVGVILGVRVTIIVQQFYINKLRKKASTDTPHAGRSMEVKIIEEGLLVANSDSNVPGGFQAICSSSFQSHTVQRNKLSQPVKPVDDVDSTEPLRLDHEEQTRAVQSSPDCKITIESERPEHLLQRAVHKSTTTSTKVDIHFPILESQQESSACDLEWFLCESSLKDVDLSSNKVGDVTQSLR